jgi:hypothetical protein
MTNLHLERAETQQRADCSFTFQQRVSESAVDVTSCISHQWDGAQHGPPLPTPLASWEFYRAFAADLPLA